MSAIAGLRRAALPRERAHAEIDRMLQGLSLYGTGDPRRWCDEGIALGRWLIPTVPEDEFDRQPCAMAGERFQVVADVRLDNRPDLLSSLGLSTREGAALADSAIVALAWERWREDCFARLVGEYAVAIWDSVEQRLLLARDPLAGRPLYFHHSPDLAAFASMPSGLHALDGIPRALDEERLEKSAILSLDVGDRSFYKGVRVVSAGELVTLSASGVARRMLWQPESITPLRLPKPADYADALRESLDRAVASQLRRIGPIGSQLSAGFDSSSVTTSAALALAQTSSRLVSFTAAPRPGYDLPNPPGRIGDESAIAADVAAMYPNIDHVIVRSNGVTTPFDHLDRNVALYQQPLVNLCNQVWIDAICDEARSRGIRTILTGNFGNATISHRDSSVLGDMVTAGQTGAALREAALLVRNGHLSWRGFAAPFRNHVPGPIYALAVRLLTRERPEVNLSVASVPHPRLKDAQSRAAATWGRDRWGRPRKGVDLRVRLLRSLDASPYMKGVLAGWHVDFRSPVIDRRVVETCLAMPPREFIRGGIPGSVLRRAVGSRLPPSLLNERLRGGQGVDWHEGVTAGRPTLSRVLSQMEGDPLVQRLLDLPRLRGLVDTWPNGGWHRQEVVLPYRILLLRAVSFGHFVASVKGGIQL